MEGFHWFFSSIGSVLIKERKTSVLQVVDNPLAKLLRSYANLSQDKVVESLLVILEGVDLVRDGRRLFTLGPVLFTFGLKKFTPFQISIILVQESNWNWKQTILFSTHWQSIWKLKMTQNLWKILFVFCQKKEVLRKSSGCRFRTPSPRSRRWCTGAAPVTRCTECSCPGTKCWTR
jgi:hypothetical protein